MSAWITFRGSGVNGALHLYQLKLQGGGLGLNIFEITNLFNLTSAFIISTFFHKYFVGS